MAKGGEQKFEDALAALEQIVAELENDDLSLDEAIAKFEKGMKLSALCQKKLEEAQQKIVKVQEAADGGLAEELVETSGQEASLFDQTNTEEIPF